MNEQFPNLHRKHLEQIDKMQKRMQKLMQEKEYSYRDLQRYTGISRSTLQRYIAGVTSKIPMDSIKKIAQALGTTQSHLLGWNIDRSAFHRIPILGTVSCGEPIFAEQTFDGYVSSDIKCDFALHAKGDSMIGARIHDGDIVFVRNQADVDDGQIAVVIIEDEATLKRVYHAGRDTLVLQAENPKYAPIIVHIDETTNVRILGKAVAFQGMVR